MTRDEIKNMHAGRELDTLVAEKVMGYRWYWRKVIDIIRADLMHSFGLPSFESFIRDYGFTEGKPENADLYDSSGIPSYSTDIAAAWQVIEKLKSTLKDNNREPDFLTLQIFPDGEKFGEYYFAKTWAHHDGDIPEVEVAANTAPLAICRAALLAVMDGEI